MLRPYICTKWVKFMNQSDQKKIWIRGGHLVDPSQNRDGQYDVVVENGVVADVFACGSQNHPDAEVVEAKGLVVSPGFIDLHTHLREPGFEYKETIESGTLSAVSGGFTSVCCMANTSPVNDNVSVTDYILKKAHESGLCRVYPIGAITKGLKGEELANVAELKRAGCVAISDDGLTVQSASLMRYAMEYAKSFDLPVSTHSIDASLCKQGHMNESLMSTRLGIKGVPAAAEDVIIARDIMLAELTGAHLHVGHLSTSGGVRLVKDAKSRGLKVTCEVTPHHFTLTDESVADYDTNFKMCPPLRSRGDVETLCGALAEGGVIDAIATDHAPHGVIDKQVEFDRAAFGVIGFETALPLALNLVRQKILTLPGLVEVMSTKPASVFCLPGGTLKKGAPADITVFDPDHEWEYTKEGVVSKSKNSPFLGWNLKGRVVRTIVGGNTRYGS